MIRYADATKILIHDVTAGSLARSRLWFGCVALLLVLIAPSLSSAAAVLTIDLANPVLDYSGPNTLQVDVLAKLQSGTPADELDFFQLSVTASDTLLTAAGTDFSKFSFAADAGLTNWTSPTFFTNGVLFLTTPDNFMNPATPISADNVFHTLGKLTVDFTGLAPGTSFISLQGSSPDDTIGLGTIDGNYQSVLDAGGSVIFDNDPLSFSTTSVPEPGTLGLISLGACVALVFRRRRDLGVAVSRRSTDE